MRPPLRPVQRTAAYGVVNDGSGALLLLRVPAGSDPEGRWSLPGGVVRHGEHPRDRVRAGLLEQTGLRAATITPRDAGADVVELPDEGISVHTLRLLFDVTLYGTPAGIPGPGRPAVDQRSRSEQGDRLLGEDPAALDPSDELPAPVALVVTPDPGRPVAQFVGRFMAPGELAGLSLSRFLVPFLDGNSSDEALLLTGSDLLDPLLDPPLDPAALVEPVPSLEEVPAFVQRPAAYAVLVNEKADGGPRMLLSRLAGSESTWTLPGGGIDHGEHPRPALRREIHEEAGLPYTEGPLIDISSRHFVGRGPHGRLEDFHALRLIYAGSVPFDQEPQVMEVDGSTDEAAWIPVADLDTAGAVPTAHDALAAWQAYRDGEGLEAVMDRAADARGDEMIDRPGS